MKSTLLNGPENSQTQSIIAFEGASLKDIKQYYALNVLSHLLGSGNNHYIPTLARKDSLLQHSVIAKNKNIRHARAFSVSYSDSGLFGVYVQGKDGSSVSDAIVATVNLIKNAAEQVTDLQLSSAKNATLVQFLSGLETAQGLNEFNAKFDSQDSHIAAIKKLTADDLKQAAKKLVSSKATLVSVGNLDGILRVSDL